MRKIRNEMFEKEKGKLVSSLLGKAIKNITVNAASYPSENEIGSFVLEFTDSTKLHIGTSGDAGCSECDPDGMNTSWISIY